MVNGSLSKVNLGGPAPASSENKPTIAAMTTGSAEFRGVFRARPHSVDKWALDGFWGDATVKFKPGADIQTVAPPPPLYHCDWASFLLCAGYPIRLGFHPDLKKFEGKLDFGMWSESWTSSFDNYLAIG